MTTAKIGTTHIGMVALADMETPIPEPKYEYSPWEDTLRLEENIERGIGFPIARWAFGYLEEEWYDQLREICPGATAHVFISTKLSDGSFSDFEADMIWPKQEGLRTMGLKPDMVFEFRNLVVVT